MRRRRLLRGLAVGAAACPLCRPAMAAEWSYQGARGPAGWGGLDGAALCGSGASQAPIDLTDATPALLRPLRFSYRPMPLTLHNDGHTVRLPVPAGSGAHIHGIDFALEDIHFHRPSEHSVDGARHAMEAHFMHHAVDGMIAVVAVFLNSGGDHPAYTPIFRHLPPRIGAPVPVPGVMVDPASLLPQERAYFTYEGSLSRPPCSENVVWVVYRAAVEVLPQQIAAFARLYSGNARPIQARDDRTLLSSA